MVLGLLHLPGQKGLRGQLEGSLEWWAHEHPPGHLSIDVSGDHNIYSLKGDHKSVVKFVLDKY